MTPDGIETADWDRVHELAVQIVNASAVDDDSAGSIAVARLFELLNELDLKYGPKPSLAATRADYAESLTERERLLLHAYDLAQNFGESKNLVWIASSIASFYIEVARDHDRGANWLFTFREHLVVAPDESETKELHRLETILLRTR